MIIKVRWIIWQFEFCDCFLRSATNDDFHYLLTSKSPDLTLNVKEGWKMPITTSNHNPKTEIHIEMEHRKTANYLGRLQLDFDIYNDVFFI